MKMMHSLGKTGHGGRGKGQDRAGRMLSFVASVPYTLWQELAPCVYLMLQVLQT